MKTEKKKCKKINDSEINVIALHELLLLQEYCILLFTLSFPVKRIPK